MTALVPTGAEDAALADPGLWARVESWIGWPRLEGAAWWLLTNARPLINPTKGETELALLSWFVLDAVEGLEALMGADWTEWALRDLADQAAQGRIEGFTL